MPVVVPLDTDIHNREGFHCGVEPLDRYIRERAANDTKQCVAVCYVLTADGDPSTILGFYTLSSLSVELAALPATASKRLPKYPQVPATLIGRLAVSSDCRGQRIGKFLLLDALRRVFEAADSIGSAFVVVDAKDEKAVGFYLQYGFQRLTAGSTRLFVPMAVVAQLF